MKQLKLYNESYQEILKSFKNWLDILGFADSTLESLPNHLQEFFYYLENHNIHTINHISYTNCKRLLQPSKNEGQ